MLLQYRRQGLEVGKGAGSNCKTCKDESVSRPVWVTDLSGQLCHDKAGVSCGEQG